MLLRTKWVMGLVLVTIAAAAGADTSPVVPAGGATQADLEKGFAKTMSNATLAGSYSLSGSKKGPAEDHYTLGSVTRKEGTRDTWTIVANIQFGGRNIAIPLELPVKWAGDTAVITVDNVGVPGLGKYTARVMIHGDQYAGTWGSSDGSHGGQMWGKIQHTAPATVPASPAPVSPAK